MKILWCVFLFLAIIVKKIESKHVLKKRMVGGQRAPHGSLPYIITIRRQDERYYETNLCIGTLIKPCWILTSAVCIVDDKIEGLSIFSNLYDLQKMRYQLPHEVSKVHLHPQFNNMSKDNNVALIQLKECIKSSNLVRPINLGSFNESTEHVRAIGWNKLSWMMNEMQTFELSSMLLKVTSTKNCLRVFPSTDTSQICAYSESHEVDLCKSDSGGPLIDDESGEQIGIVSDATFFRGFFRDECQPKYRLPLLFTRIEKYQNWVAETMEQTTISEPGPSVPPESVRPPEMQAAQGPVMIEGPSFPHRQPPEVQTMT